MKPETGRQRQRFGKPFESLLVPNKDGCLEWQGPTDKDGYGRRGSRLGEKRAHRHAYSLKHGPIPEGAVVRHACDNPLCCNPEHLVLGNHLQNIGDKISRNRQAAGSKIRTTKVTPEIVLEIRAMSAAGIRQFDIADKFGIDQTTVSQIVTRKTWKNL